MWYPDRSVNNRQRQRRRRAALAQIQQVQQVQQIQQQPQVPAITPVAQPVAGAPGIPLNEPAMQQWEHAVNQDTGLSGDTAVESVEARKKSPIHDDPTMTPMERQLDAVRQENIASEDLQQTLDGGYLGAGQLNPSSELHRGEFQARSGKSGTAFQNPNQTSTQTLV